MRSAVAGKARVHELAKELGVESKNVLAKLKEMGEFVKSASSTVEAPVARRLKEAFAAGLPAPSAPPAAAATTASESKVSAKPMPPKKKVEAAPPVAAKPKAPSMLPPAPVAKPASAHEIEVAAAEARAAALKAEQEAARAAQAQQRERPAGEGGPKPSFMPPRPGSVAAGGPPARPQGDRRSGG